MLTTHFRLSEFTCSGTATRNGICNEPGIEAISNIQHLCQEVLEPLRQHVGVPVVISSGFRCTQLNTLVGGVSNSQHRLGEAADIIPCGHFPRDEDRNAVLRPWFEFIRDHLPFDQLIWERSSRLSHRFWIHVSLRRNGRNRHQVIDGLVKHSPSPLPLPGKEGGR